MRSMKHADSKRDALRLLPALRGLDDRELAKLARLVDEVTVEAGKTLITEGDVGREAFVIAEGTARVTIGGEIVCELGPGEIVGEMAMFEHRPRTASVVAATPMRLLAVGPADFYAFAGLPPVARAVTSTLVSRLRAADTRIQQLATEA
jgi:CRP/FNR family transcriptional regulator, cyclic AMP receptor protein